MSRYRVWVSGFYMELEANELPVITDPDGDVPAQLEGVTTADMLRHLRADAMTTVTIEVEDHTNVIGWRAIAIKTGVGGWHE